MSSSGAAIVGAAERLYERHPPPETSTEDLLTDAVTGALESAGLRRDDVDGLGVVSFTLGPDSAIDLAWRLGFRLRWLMQDTNGGAAGVNMLQHAVRAIEAGDATTIVLVAGDRMTMGDFTDLVNAYNKATRDHLAPLDYGGPNVLFSFLTQRHMEAHGLGREDYAAIPVSQRRWAMRNPGAAYRTPLSLDECLDAPLVAPPLGRYDCVPVVSGADAIVVRAMDAVGSSSAVEVCALRTSFNADQQVGSGLTTGLASVANELWSEAGFGPGDVDLAAVYDDYPVMVMVQLTDMGIVAADQMRDFLRQRLLSDGWPLNTSGGMLSAGQAGSGAALHGLVEATLQLLGRCGPRQVEDARRALVSGYGMVLYRWGACASAVALERNDA